MCISLPFIKHIVDISVNLLGISFALLALFPGFWESFKASSTDFVDFVEGRKMLYIAIRFFLIDVILFSISLGSGLGFEFTKYCFWALISILSFVVGTLVILAIAIYITSLLKL